MPTAADVTFSLPFEIHFRSRAGSPLVFDTNECRFVLYPDLERGPSLKSVTGDDSWATDAIAVEISCDFADAGFSESEIPRRAQRLALRFLEIYRWRTRQSQIVPTESSLALPSVQFFETGPANRPVRQDGGGARLVVPPSNMVASVTSFALPIAAPFPATLVMDVVADLNANAIVPLWDDYILSASREPKLARRIVDLGIAMEVFIFEYLQRTSPGFRLPKKTKKGEREKGLPERTYKDAVVLLKGRDISSELPNAYREICYLYKARNSVAHKGMAKYANDAGTVVSVTRPILDGFRRGLDECIRWVEALP